MKRIFKSSCLFVAVFCVSVFGGNLEPSGPPTSGTMKPLSQVEPRTAITSLPYTISAGGSYYLASNLTVSNNNGIIVDADDVTIDFCGFIISGSGSSGYGIYMYGRKNVTIRNGTIKNFPFQGIMEGSLSGTNHVVENLRVIGSKYRGINLYGAGHIISNCHVLDTQTAANADVIGIFTGSACIIKNNVVSNNGSSNLVKAANVNGINAGNGSVVTGNTVYKNGEYATGDVCGLGAGNSCTVKDNAVYANGGWSMGAYVYGIFAMGGTTVVGNSTYNNGQNSTAGRYGIYCGGYNLVDQNASYNNGTNINFLANCTYGKNYPNS